MIETEWLIFVGTNERANPPMPLAHLEKDMERLSRAADSMVVQEFRLRSYWRRAASMMRAQWASSPTWTAGVLAPVAGGQPCFWRRDIFKRVRDGAWLMHGGIRKISEDRYMRRAFLEHLDTGLRVWKLNGHCVVGADEEGGGPIRQDILYTQDLPALDRALERSLRGGWPLIGHIDANIHRGSAAYDDLMAIFDKHGARVIGEHGVEYLFVVDGRKARVIVGSHRMVKPRHRGGKLWTDHEARVLRYKLRQM